MHLFYLLYQIWYALAKTESEERALEYGKRNGLHVVTLLPGLVFDPLLQTVVLNTSSKVLVYIIKRLCILLILFNSSVTLVLVSDKLPCIFIPLQEVMTQ